jgi:NAD(P)H-dependent FMN reductase
VLIQVISSTTREGRFSERTAHWVVRWLRTREHFDVELIDLREYPLPFFDAPPPAKAPRDYATAEVAPQAGDVSETTAFAPLEPKLKLPADDLTWWAAAPAAARAREQR